MAKIGMSLSTENMIELVKDLIKGTEFEKKYLGYMEECNIQHCPPHGIVGFSWYNKFMKQNKDKLQRGRCRPWDINWYS
jgi:hypothetical protein